MSFNSSRVPCFMVVQTKGKKKKSNWLATAPYKFVSDCKQWLKWPKRGDPKLSLVQHIHEEPASSWILWPCIVKGSMNTYKEAENYAKFLELQSETEESQNNEVDDEYTESAEIVVTRPSRIHKKEIPDNSLNLTDDFNEILCKTMQNNLPVLAEPTPSIISEIKSPFLNESLLSSSALNDFLNDQHTSSTISYNQPSEIIKTAPNNVSTQIKINQKEPKLITKSEDLFKESGKNSLHVLNFGDLNNNDQKYISWCQLQAIANNQTKLLEKMELLETKIDTLEKASNSQTVQLKALIQHLATDIGITKLQMEEIISDEFNEIKTLIPIKSYEDMENLEHYLTLNNQNFKKFCNYFTKFFGTNQEISQCRRDMYTLFYQWFDKDFQPLISWTGASKSGILKRAIEGKEVVAAFFEIIKTAYNHTTMRDVESFFKYALKNANSRTKKKTTIR